MNIDTLRMLGAITNLTGGLPVARDMKKGDRTNAVIDAIRKADTFLTSSEIRDAVGVRGKANEGQYATVSSAISYLRGVSKVVGIELWQKRGDFFIRMHLNGLPDSYHSVGQPKPEYEEKLFNLIHELNLYFFEDGLYRRPIDY